MAALDAGLDDLLKAGMVAIREKSIALSGLFISLADAQCGDLSPPA